MSSTHIRFTHVLSSLVLAGVLPACGGGGDDGPVPDASLGRTSSVDAAENGCGIPDFANQMLAEVNRVRAQGQQCGANWHAPVAPLSWNAALADAAASHSADMATHNFVSHTGSSGSSVADRARGHGYASGGVGENLAGGHQNIGHMMQGVLASPAHCANLLRPSYVSFGAACVSNSATVYKRHWAQVFGE